MLKRLLNIVLVSAVVLAVGLALLLWFGSRDLPGYDDRGIPDIAARTPARGFNAYDHLKYLDEPDFEFDLTEDELRDLHVRKRLDEWELGSLVSVLRRNESHIQSFIYASDQAYLSQPVKVEDFYVAYASLRYYTLAYLTLFKSRLLAASGNLGPAVDHALAVLRFSELLLHDYGRAPLVSYSLGSVMQADALDFIQELVSAHEIGPELLARLAHSVDRLPAYTRDGYDRLLAGELMASIALQEYLVGGDIAHRWELYVELSGDVGGFTAATGAWSYHLGRLLNVVAPGYLLHSNRAFGELSRIYEGYIAESSKPCSEIEMPEARMASRSWTWRQIGPNGAGTVAQEDVDGFLGFFERRCYLHASRQALRAFLANERYQRDNGSYASQPAELVPRYLVVLPVDAFNNEPLKFDREAALLYSVGTNGSDNGGEIRCARAGRVACARDPDCLKNPTFYFSPESMAESEPSAAGVVAPTE